uniref:CLASP_N domain-containing protein n=1 Tax=Macrostomum lignano TaxID=282301 RepID=A0A1I8F7K2_9PLAT
MEALARFVTRYHAICTTGCMCCSRPVADPPSNGVPGQPSRRCRPHPMPSCRPSLPTCCCASCCTASSTTASPRCPACRRIRCGSSCSCCPVWSPAPSAPRPDTRLAVSRLALMARDEPAARRLLTGLARLNPAAMAALARAMPEGTAGAGWLRRPGLPAAETDGQPAGGRPQQQQPGLHSRRSVTAASAWPSALAQSRQRISGPETRLARSNGEQQRRRCCLWPGRQSWFPWPTVETESANRGCRRPAEAMGGKRQADRKDRLQNLHSLLREKSIDSWDEHFKSVLLVLLETMVTERVTFRAASLTALQELLTAQPTRFADFLELTLLKIAGGARRFGSPRIPRRRGLAKLLA